MFAIDVKHNKITIMLFGSESHGRQLIANDILCNSALREITLIAANDKEIAIYWTQ